MKKILLTTLFCLAAMGLQAQKVKHAETYNYQRGVEAVQNEKYDEGIEYLKKEISADNKNGYAFGWLQAAYLNKEMWSEALTMSEKALKYIPAKDKKFRGWVYNARGIIYRNLEEREKALEQFSLAIKTNPEDTDYFEERAELYYQMEQFDLSTRDYETVAGLDAGNKLTDLGIGRNLLRQERYSEAVSSFDRAIRINQDFARGYAFRADAYLGLGDYRKGVADLIKALEIGNDDRAYHTMIGLEGEARDELLLKLGIEQKKHPSVAMWYYYQGVIYQYAEIYQKAIEAYGKGKKQDNDNIFDLRLSECYSEIGVNDLALYHIDQALERDTTDAELLMSRADILYEMGRGKEAVEQMDAYVDAFPDYFGGYYRRAFMKDNLHDVEGSIEDYTIAISLKPDYPYAYLGRADQYIKQGREQLAKKDYEQVILQDTVVGESNCAHYALQALGRETESLEFMRRILENSSSAGNLYDAACLNARMGKKKEALDYLRRSLEKGFRRLAHISMDDDMDSLREMEEFKALIREYEEKLKQENFGKSSEETGEYVEQLMEIPFQKDGDMLKVKCDINGLPLHFIFDTGCSDVSISQVEANFMMKNDYLSSADVVGQASFKDANGNVSVGTLLNLKKVRIGDIELNNVRASVVKNLKAPLLLGQSILGRLGKIEIDNPSRKMLITRKIKK